MGVPAIRLVVEMRVCFSTVQTVAGSFDSVRLSPHYAQDDSPFKEILWMTRVTKIPA